jgi:hypothetical protein
MYSFFSVLLNLYYWDVQFCVYLRFWWTILSFKCIQYVRNFVLIRSKLLHSYGRRRRGKKESKWSMKWNFFCFFPICKSSRTPGLAMNVTNISKKTNMHINSFIIKNQLFSSSEHRFTLSSLSLSLFVLFASRFPIVKAEQVTKRFSARCLENK